MTLMNRTVVVFAISAALLLSSVPQAMEIREYDKMADDDQDEYVGDLVAGAMRVLKQAGPPDLAAQVSKLFTVIHPGDKISDGMAEFEVLLAKARVADLKRLQADPNARRLEVEDAMVLTLKKNGIEVPDSFFTVNNNFHRKFPPKQ